MLHIITRNIIFCCFLSFSGLADAGSVDLDFPTPQVSNLSFTLNDMRPPKQLKTGPEAFSAGNCAFSSSRIGDDLFNPSRVDLVAERLQRDYSTQFAGKNINIENFVIHRNFGKQRRDALRDQNKAMANAAPMSCAPDDLRGGYSPEETPNDVAPIVIVLDLLIDKVPIHVRTVYEPVLRIEGEKPIVYTRRSLTAAMNEFLDKLTKEINSKIRAETASNP
jgi:hypothetical protein